MVESISYKRSVMIMAKYYSGDMFHASYILALLFKKDKEITMRDLLKEREKWVPR